MTGEDGEQIGIVTLRAALEAAEEAGCDLVEIAPMAKPPVCRLMDFGKYKYEEAKRAHEAKQKQKQIQVKEVKLRPGTDENDYQIKLRNLIKFLTEGDKAKVTLRFMAVKWLTRSSVCASSSASRPTWKKSVRSSRCRRWKGAR